MGRHGLLQAACLWVRGDLTGHVTAAYHLVISQVCKGLRNSEQSTPCSMVTETGVRYS